MLVDKENRSSGADVSVGNKRKKAQDDEQQQEILRLQLTVKELRQELDSHTHFAQQEELQKSLDQKEQQLATVQQDMERLHEYNEKLLEEMSGIKRQVGDLKSQLTLSRQMLATREREHQQLVSRSKDQSSRIAQLEPYRSKYQSLREKHQKLQSARLQEQEQKITTLTHNQLETINRQLRVKLADCQFQLKKLTEDGATYRTLTEMQKVRANKQHENRVAAMKRQSEEENKNWICRFEQRDQEFKRDVEIIKNRYNSQKQLYQQNLRNEMQEFKKKIERDRDTKIQAIQKKLKDETTRLKSQHDSTVNSLTKNHETAINDINLEHWKQSENKKKQFQAHLFAAVAERRTEESMHQKTKQELAKIKEKLYDELYQVRKEKTAVQNDLRNANDKITQLLEQIDNINQSVSLMKAQHSETVEELAEQYNQKLIESKRIMQQNIQNLLSEQLEKTEGLSLQLKDLESTNQQQTQIYEKQVQQLNNFFEERPSRQEDLKKIQELQARIMKKDSDIEKLTNELKWHRLELENKEDTYNRIFASGMNQVRIPTQNVHGGLKLQAREFKFRKMARSLLQQKDTKSQQLAKHPNRQ